MLHFSTVFLFVVSAVSGGSAAVCGFGEKSAYFFTGHFGCILHSRSVAARYEGHSIHFSTLALFACLSALSISVVGEH